MSDNSDSLFYQFDGDDICDDNENEKEELSEFDPFESELDKDNKYALMHYQLCNPHSNNPVTEQVKDYSETPSSTDPNKIDKIYDEATNFSSIDSFSKNGISHATNQALGQGSSDPSLKSAPSQVENEEEQDLIQVDECIPQLSPFMNKDLNANSSPNQINTNNPPYSYSNRLKNNLTGQISDSSPPPTKFNYTFDQNFSDDDNSSPAAQEKSSHALIYKKGKEAERMQRKYVHYNHTYKNCEIYKEIQSKTKDHKIKEKVNEIGEKYNEYFKVLISDKKFPYFGRDFKRNLGLAVWFFQDMMFYIRKWIYEKINEI